LEAQITEKNEAKPTKPAKLSFLRLREPSERNIAWLFIIPSLLVIFGLNLYPILYSFWLSLHDVKLTKALHPFIGLQNYIDILSSTYFWSSIRITFYFVAVSMSLQMVWGFLIALILNQKFFGRGFVRAFILIPWAVPTIVNGILWEWIYNANYGALNGILFQLGLIDTYKNWLGEPWLALNMIILADTWKMTPFYVIMYLAGLQTIPGELYESAKIDGAGIWKRFVHIMLPMLKPIILVILVLRTMQAFKVFDIIYIMTKGGPAGGTMVISFYTYTESFGNLNFGYGSAMSFIIAIVIMSIAVLYKRMLDQDR
jgi:multiple sugar transport system permease protein/N,N'-diacetylchitobiose transport system permease protein